MRNGKYSRKRRAFGGKGIALMLAMFLLVGGVIGGTIAWLTDDSGPVTNTFTTSDIGVSLNETKEDFKMIPGWSIDKDPKASVTSTSEDAYLFVKVEETNAKITKNDDGTYSLGDYLDYAIDKQWTALENVDNVFYIKIDTADEKGKAYNILGEGKRTYEEVEYSWDDDQVLTKPTVTKEMMNAITSGKEPKLTFTAYAVQLWKTNKPADGASAEAIADAQFSAQEAWAQVNKSATTTTTP